MDERRIIVKPFEMISNLRYEGVQQVNEHGTVKITGIIKREKAEDYMALAETETWVWVSILNGDRTETPVFCGILIELELRTEGEVCVIELALSTGSRLMDETPHIRSFQEPGYPYEKAVKCCSQTYPKAGVIMTKGKKGSLPGFMMQYQETDWQFLKRLAGSLHTILVPSYKGEGTKYFFGLPEKQSKEVLDTDSYTLRREKAQGEQESGLDTTTYIVTSRKHCELGDIVWFLGKQLWIWRVETELEGNELVHTYYLRDRKGMEGFPTVNQQLTGLSLLGEVTAVGKEQVQVKLTEEENGECGSRWFRFSTVYSSADGAGWYCMPETGDKARLCFPTAEEAEAYVSSGYHENQGGGIRVNPEHKIWRNKEGKEIRMTPDKILITNNQGMFVELSDQKGITINSSRSIQIEAGQVIGISSSGSNVELDASNAILLRQGGTVMEISEGIRLSGGKINMQ